MHTYTCFCMLGLLRIVCKSRSSDIGRVKNWARFITALGFGSVNGAELNSVGEQ